MVTVPRVRRQLIWVNAITFGLAIAFIPVLFSESWRPLYGISAFAVALALGFVLGRVFDEPRE